MADETYLRSGLQEWFGVSQYSDPMRHVLVSEWKWCWLTEYGQQAVLEGQGDQREILHGYSTQSWVGASAGHIVDLVCLVFFWMLMMMMLLLLLLSVEGFDSSGAGFICFHLFQKEKERTDSLDL
jgi:hypothetical protein